MPKKDPNIIGQINMRRVNVIVIISLVLVILILLAFMMESGMKISLHNLLQVHREHPSMILIDLLPFFIAALLYPMNRIMNRAIREYGNRVKASNELLRKNTVFAQELSEGDNPEPYEEMMETDLGKVLRMIQLNIKSNRRKEREQSWIAEGKDIISKILREHQELDELSYQVLQGLIQYISATQGAFYLYDEENLKLTNRATYAYNRRKFVDQVFSLGEGLVGQCAYEMDYVYRTEIPEDYVSITSGLMGEQKPRSILLVPLISNESLHGIVEFAFLEERIPKLTIQFLLELGDIIARTLMNLKMNLRTQQLLEDSRKLTEELQNNEIQLQENAGEMKKARDDLEKANVLLERKMEEASNATERIHLMLEHASEIISIYDKNLNLVYISPSVIHISGYTAEEMMSGKDMERMVREDALQLKLALEWLKEHPDDTRSLDLIFNKKNGKRMHIRTLCRNRLNDPAIKGFVLNIRDMTESIRMEKEQRLKTRMQSLSENSLDLILRISQSGLIHYANPVVEDYTGLSPSSIISRNHDELPFHNSFRELLKGILDAMAENPSRMNHQVSLPLLLGDHKSERILSMDAIPEFQEGELETILLVGHDITEAKRIEKEIKVQNRKVQDSINYAERIQSSILPEEARIHRAFPRSFVYYRPRDVISGDFPWLFETKDAWFIAAVDCTGHGVPGALLSLVGMFLMNNLVGLNPSITPGELCEALHREVRHTLKQDRGRPETRDGMDMALCKFMKKESRMEFAGAHRPLLQLSEGEVIVHKGDRKAIGGIPHPRKQEQAFTNMVVDYSKGDKFFIYTDGLTDQMGGPEGLKYGSARVRQVLLENPGYTMPQLHDLFRSDLEGWMENERQLDDLLLIGIEAS